MVHDQQVTHAPRGERRCLGRLAHQLELPMRVDGERIVAPLIPQPRAEGNPEV